MKTQIMKYVRVMISTLTLASCLANAEEAKQKLLEPNEFAHGRVIITSKKRVLEGGAYKDVTKLVCSKEIVVPVYSNYGKNGEDDTVTFSEKYRTTCQAELLGVKVYPMVGIHKFFKTITEADLKTDWAQPFQGYVGKTIMVHLGYLYVSPTADTGSSTSNPAMSAKEYEDYQKISKYLLNNGATSTFGSTGQPSGDTFMILQPQSNCWDSTTGKADEICMSKEEFSATVIIQESKK